MARGLILAVRHPRPKVGARICLGRTDAELAEPAEAAADAVMDAIGHEERIERIISSPLLRAASVARVLARWSGASLHEDDRLTEQDFGAWSARAWASLPRGEVAAWEADPVHVAPGGGESGAAMLRRVRHAWSRLASGEGTTVLLTHAGPIQCLLHVAAGVRLEEALQRGVPFGAVVRLG